MLWFCSSSYWHFTDRQLPDWVKQMKAKDYWWAEFVVLSGSSFQLTSSETYKDGVCFIHAALWGLAASSSPVSQSHSWNHTTGRNLGAKMTSTQRCFKAIQPNNWDLLSPENTFSFLRSECVSERSPTVDRMPCSQLMWQTQVHSRWKCLFNPLDHIMVTWCPDLTQNLVWVHKTLTGAWSGHAPVKANLNIVISKKIQ